MMHCEVTVVVWGEVGQWGDLRAWDNLWLWSEGRMCNMVWSKVLVCSGIRGGSYKMKVQA